MIPKYPDLGYAFRSDTLNGAIDEFILFVGMAMAVAVILFLAHTFTQHRSTAQDDVERLAMKFSHKRPR